MKPLLRAFDACRRLLGECGLYRSLRNRESIDGDGRPVPWLSYPAIYFLDRLNLEGARVCEYGTGNSTLYWAERKNRANGIKSYLGIEYDGAYYIEMNRKNGFYRDNVQCPRESQYLALPYTLATQGTNLHELFVPYDLFIVDGPIQRRSEELRAAVKSTCSEGLIVVDDSNWLADDVRTICEKYAMARVDFAGFGPGVSYTKVTSILFRNPAWLYGGDRAPITPPGGMRSFPGMG